MTGVVQGVGFRPFIYGLALEHHLTGFVGNDSGGVFIEVEGSPPAVTAFQQDLIPKQPPLAHIESVQARDMPVERSTQFTIVHSQSQAARQTLISPDITVCHDCLAELQDPNNRRFGYPFINCTNCGPRFTIIKDIPYDRPMTTMAEFPMCDQCQAEYENPLDRRFHAQPNACPVCGPHVWLENKESPGTEIIAREAALTHARKLLQEGKIVAVKGLGGFHLACDATNEEAITRLRQRKGRVDKPFAVMALDVETVRRFASVSPEEEEWLTSKERPILLLQKKRNSLLSAGISPGNRAIGVMLPYTPLHTLLLQPADENKQPLVLIMTSGNFSDEPIVKGNDQAPEQLGRLADAFLMHNRPIHARCDDSVLRLIPTTTDHSPLSTAHPLPIRRSRGYAPFPVKLPFSVPPILAVGGELKATFCLANEEYAYMSQHIGDLENLETMQALETAVNHYQHIFRVRPQIIACDMHPVYLSTRWAEEQAGERPLIKVQHHHAHIAALMAEKGLDGSQPVIGFSFDGTGYGPDGAIWGGELLIADYKSYNRAAHLAYMPLVGGDAAVKRPYRLALAYLHAAGIPWAENLFPFQACPPQERRLLARQLETGLNVVPTSSMGRLFDAVTSLLGLRHEVSYEGQAAIELESVANDGGIPYRVELVHSQVAVKPILAAILADMAAEKSTAEISTRFHATIAHIIRQLSGRIRDETNLNIVALSGGVFQNMKLLRQTIHLLETDGFQVLHHHLVPPNDGGLALGQAIIAASTA